MSYAIDMTVDRYKQLTSKIMVGKKGFIRSVNSIRVDGSMKMVISISRDIRP